MINAEKENISWNKRNQIIWKQYVKQANLTNEHPGYKYIYFRNELDAHDFFKNILGEDWKTQSWVKFLLRRTEESIEIRDRRREERYVLSEDFLENGRITNYYLREPNNYEYLIKYYVTKLRITNIEKIKKLLDNKGYKTDYNKVRAYYNKYYKTYRQKNPSRDIINEFVKYYNSQGLSLRKIGKLLEKDSIYLSHTQVCTIIKELKNG